MATHDMESLNMNNKIKKIILSILLLVTIVSLVVGCNKKSDELSASVSPSATVSPNAVNNDVAESTAYIAKMGDILFYESDFYNFVSTAAKEMYYNSDIVFEEDLTDDEKYEAVLKFFEQKAENSDKTNLQVALDRALEILHTYNIAAKLGKEMDLLTDEEKEEIISDIDDAADYYAAQYGTSRDEAVKYIYGMHVNDAKRYSIAQAYASAHMSEWLASQGYTFDKKAPSAPKKPSDPGDDATDDEKSEYQTKLDEYNKTYAEYETELAKYNDEVQKYWEQYRSEYTENKGNYTIVTVRTLYVSILDEDGKALPDAEKQKKYNDTISYMKLVTESGYDFEKVVKGFSEADDKSNGLYDLDAENGGSAPLSDDIIEWSMNNAKISDDLKLFEEENGYYIVQVVGITNFDKTEGVVASSEISPELVKQTVEYVFTSEKYNDYMKELIKESKYELTDVNYDRIAELANAYLTDTSELGEE